MLAVDDLITFMGRVYIIIDIRRFHDLPPGDTLDMMITVLDSVCQPVTLWEESSITDRFIHHIKKIT